MRARLLVLGLVLLLAGGVCATAQTTGEIYGKVSDTSGAMLPGVNITLTSPVLLQPLAAVSSENGSYRFPQLPIGLYSVKFELTGFRSIIKAGIRVEIGFNALINQVLEISTVEETVSVTAESPLVDTRDTGRTTRFTQEALQSIPSARDPWVILEQSAGVAMDRQNVGGSASGQQSNFVARGAATTQQKWNLDGIDITDMSATGGSPVYFDFDAFEEMQISTGGADVSMQSPGVGVNLVTKSGTDRLKGTGRYYVTDDKFQSNNVTDDLRKNGVNTGNPIQNIKDYGFEVGGPIVKGRAWAWGSYGKQNINVGINNFFKADSNCQAMRATPLNYSLEEIWTCLNSDTTILNNYNAKFSAQVFRNNQASFYFNGAEKLRNARDASDLRPIETTYRQMGVTRADLGSSWWKTGMPKTYKWSDRHIFSDRWMLEGSYSHVGNNFTLTFHEDGLRDVQPMFDIATSAYARSYLESVYVRPTDSIDLMSTYFLPNTWGGDHALKVGFKYRNDIAHSETHYGGFTIARFTNFASMAASQAQMYRDSITEYQLFNRNFYLQDSFTRGRITLNAGVRFDYQTDEAHVANVVQHPFYGQASYAGDYSGATYTGATFNQLPALNFPGADSGGAAFTDFSPRFGFSYDLTGNGRNVLKLNYSRYVGQLGTGTLSSTYNTVTTASVRYPWIDKNSDRTVQANEVVLTAAPLAFSGNYDPNKPTAASSPGTNDKNISSDKTDEFIVGFDRAFGSDFAVSASYIWRKYSNFAWSDLTNWDSANYAAVNNYQGTCSVAGARCETITYYQPTTALPAAYVYTNRPDYWRGYNGFEITGRKRMSHGWLANISYSYNDAPVHYDSAAAYEDPTNIENLDGGQFAPESTSSGLGNVFINAKWLFRLSGAYTTPLWGINVAGFFNARSGYPFVASIQTPSRANSAGIASVYLDTLGDNRLPNFKSLDFRVDKSFTLFSHLRLTPAMDVFNLMNGNTSLSIRGTQNASTANQISSILAPRVIRFGVRASW